LLARPKLFQPSNRLLTGTVQQDVLKKAVKGFAERISDFLPLIAKRAFGQVFRAQLPGRKADKYGRVTIATDDNRGLVR